MKIKKFFCALLFIVFFGLIAEYVLLIFSGKNLHQILFSSLYTQLFLSNSFDCENKDLQKRIQNGYKVMKNTTIVFAGLARDIQKSLPKTMERIEATGKFFKNYQVVVFENDSSDETRLILEQWQRKNVKVHSVTCPEDAMCKLNCLKMYDYGPRSQNRIEKMADFRNRYLKVIQEHYYDFDYVMVLDFDMQGPWSIDGIADTFGYTDWDAIFANGLHSLIGTYGQYLVMYDGMAYVGVDQSFMEKQSPVKNYFKMNFIDRFNKNTSDNLIPVKSAFSGLALYTMQSLQNSFYSANQPCEHTALHEMMHKNGYTKFFINPYLQLLSGHQGPPNLLKFLLNY